MALAVSKTVAASSHLRAVATGPDSQPTDRSTTVDVEIVVPVYNEAAKLKERITTLRRFLDESFPFETLVTIVDNGSTDDTAVVAAGLAATLPGVAALSLARKGRGYALRTAWSQSTAHVVAYMDVDLSTSLTALLPLVAPLLSGHSDVAIGTRLGRGARVVRGPKRELISRSYNFLLKLALHSRISDAQCGFKALSQESAQELLPLVENDEWFFDTELLVTAERLGMRTSEVPVDWVDDPDSRVRIIATATEDLKGIWRMSHGRARRHAQEQHGGPSPFDQATSDQLLSFGGVGILSTLSYLFLFTAGRAVVGTLVANTIALAFCTLINTSVHRTLARRLHEPAASAPGRPRFAAVAAGLFTISWVLTTMALLAVSTMAGTSLALDLIAVTAANAVAAILRFSVLRSWVFRPVARDVPTPLQAVD